jgi:uncharacterized membrane protein YidH (DUF202 family)
MQKIVLTQLNSPDMCTKMNRIKNFLLETNLIINNTGSEPRDILMTERTALSWAKFGVTLAAIAITIVTNFRLDTSGSFQSNPDPDDIPDWFSTFSYRISILFVVLSIFTLAIGWVTYIQSIYSYRSHKVFTYSMKFTIGFLFVVGLILLAINLVFLTAVKV